MASASSEGVSSSSRSTGEGAAAAGPAQDGSNGVNSPSSTSTFEYYDPRGLFARRRPSTVKRGGPEQAIAVGKGASTAASTAASTSASTSTSEARAGLASSGAPYPSSSHLSPSSTVHSRESSHVGSQNGGLAVSRFASLAPPERSVRNSGRADGIHALSLSLRCTRSLPESGVACIARKRRIAHPHLSKWQWWHTSSYGSTGPHAGK